MSRRQLLVSGVVLLTGCAKSVTPSAAPSPERQPKRPGREWLTEVGALATGLLANPDSAKLSAKQIQGLTWLLDVTDDYLAAIAAAPSRPSPSPAASFPADPSGPAAVTRIGAIAETARDGWLAAAQTAAGLEPLLWVSLAASADSWAAVTRGQGTLGGPQNLLEPELLDEAAAKGQVVLAARAITFALKTVLPATKTGSKEREILTNRLGYWTELADSLADELRRAGHPVPQPPAAYDQAPADSPAAALAVLGQVESRMLEHLGRWLVSPSRPETRDRATKLLLKTYASSRSFGGPTLRWPGWPA